jgi:hypothetical protein
VAGARLTVSVVLIEAHRDDALEHLGRVVHRKRPHISALGPRSLKENDQRLGLGSRLMGLIAELTQGVLEVVVSAAIGSERRIQRPMRGQSEV